MAEGVRTRADARAARGARRSPAGVPRDPRRRHEREVDGHPHDRGAAPRRKPLDRRDRLAACRLLGRADHGRREERRLRGRDRARQAGGGVPGGDAVRDDLRSRLRGVRRARDRRRGGRGGSRRPARRDERPSLARRPADERRSRAHGCSRRDARGDRGREARGRAGGNDRSASGRGVHGASRGRTSSSAGRARRRRRSWAVPSSARCRSRCPAGSSGNGDEVCDGAHNAEGAAWLAAQLARADYTLWSRSCATRTPTRCSPRSPARGHARCDESSNGRSLPAEELARSPSGTSPRSRSSPIPPLRSARAREHGPRLVTGSLYLSPISQGTTPK